MLRLLVLLLVLANAGVYSWRQGWLDTLVGVRAQGDREPGRLALQVQPEVVRVLAPLPPPDADTREATACLEIGPYASAQLGPAEAALQAVLGPGGWVDVKTDIPPVWIVFMGPYPERELRQRKIDELKRLRVAHEEMRNVPELGDGLALGRFDDQGAADKALAELATRGVHSARVAQLSPGGTSHRLRVEQADPGLQDRLLALQAGGLQGRGFLNCKF